MPTAHSESIAAVSELPQPVASDPAAPVLRVVEWIASDPESGVLRLRGDFPDPSRAYETAPVLILRDESGSLTRRPPLNGDRPDAHGWRAAYLIAGALVGGAVEKWLEWPDGRRLALPEVDVSAGDGRTPAPPPDRGAEVFDRAVLAERRAQRAESAQRAQARTAERAVAALGALERRVEELTRERDALAQARAVPTDDARAANVRLVPAAPAATDPHSGLASELEAARAAARKAGESERRHRQALDDALGTLGRLRVQAAEMRLRMRTQIASSSADAVRLAVLESERRGFRERLGDLRGELDGLRARLAGEEAVGRRLAAELESERAHARRAGAEHDELRAALADERRARAAAELELRPLRETARAQGARVAELEAVLAEERVRVDERAEALRRRVDDLAEQLRAERAVRASLAVQLRVARSSESAARAEAAARAAAVLRPESGAAATGASRPERRLAQLEAELDDTRAALEAARARLRRATVPATSGLEAPVSTEAKGSDADTAPAAPPAPPALPPEAAAQLRRRVDVFQATASRPRGGAAEPGMNPDGPAIAEPDAVAARLDAAAAALRAAATGEAVAGGESAARQADAEAKPPRTAEALREAAVRQPSAAPVQTPARDRAAPQRPQHAPVPTPSLALTVRASSEVVVARPSVTDAARVAGARPRPPSLRRALVGLAAEDPFSAARLLAALLPAQGAFLHEDVDYDLTIRELGTFSVTVVGGRTTVRALRRPRSRRRASMHLTLHALTLAELLAGRPRRVGRVLAPVRLRGSRRGLEVLATLAEAGPTLAEVARAGAVLDPALLARVLPHLIDPTVTEGHAFTVAQEIVGETTRCWYLTADGRRGLRVATRPPEGASDARVTISRSGFERLLRAEPLLFEDKPWIRGDFTAVENLRRWIDAALA